MSAMTVGGPAGDIGGWPGRAVWFTAPRRAEILTETVRAPGAHEVTVQTIVSLISAGTEMKYYRGHADPSVGVGLPTAAGGPGFPVKFAYLCVGRVVAAGPGVSLKPGDLVYVRHPHQDLFTTPVAADGRAIVVGLPGNMDPEVAMFLNLTEVALTALIDVPVSLGDVAVVFGQGIVGILVAQLARRTAGRLVVVDPLPMRRRLALALGADEAVEPGKVEATVRAASHGRGADVVFEATGAPTALQQAIRVTGREGTVVVVSFYGDRPVELILTPEFHVGRQRIVSTMVGGLNPTLRSRWDFQRRTAAAIELLPSLHTGQMVTHRVPFENAAEAFRLLDEHAAEVLAVALTYGAGSS